MFIRNEDRETLINIIDSKDIKFIIEIIDFITKAYKKNNINKEELKEKVVYLWDKIYETVKNDSDSYKEIISKLCEWFIFVEEIDNNIMKYAKFTIKHNSLIKYSGYSKYSSYSKIFVELERLVQNSNNIKYIGELFLEIPIYKDSYIYNDTKKQIENIVESLYQNDEGEKALKICNSYNQNGIYFLKDLIKKYGGS
jgi:hypothetical protein